MDKAKVKKWVLIVAALYLLSVVIDIAIFILVTVPEILLVIVAVSYIIYYFNNKSGDSHET